MKKALSVIFICAAVIGIYVYFVGMEKAFSPLINSLFREQFIVHVHATTQDAVPLEFTINATAKKKYFSEDSAQFHLQQVHSIEEVVWRASLDMKAYDVYSSGDRKIEKQLAEIARRYYLELLDGIVNIEIANIVFPPDFLELVNNMKRAKINVAEEKKNLANIKSELEKELKEANSRKL